MAGYWFHLAANGDPNHQGAPSWLAYSPSTDLTLELAESISAKSGLLTARCDLRDSIVTWSEMLP